MSVHGDVYTEISVVCNGVGRDSHVLDLVTCLLLPIAVSRLELKLESTQRGYRPLRPSIASSNEKSTTRSLEYPCYRFGLADVKRD